MACWVRRLLCYYSGLSHSSNCVRSFVLMYLLSVEWGDSFTCMYWWWFVSIQQLCWWWFLPRYLPFSVEIPFCMMVVTYHNLELCYWWFVPVYLLCGDFFTCMCQRWFVPMYSRFKKSDSAPDSIGAESSRVTVTRPSRIESLWLGRVKSSHMPLGRVSSNSKKKKTLKNNNIYNS